MSSYVQQAALAATPAFLPRVQAAITKAAAAILAEANDPSHPVSFAMKTTLATGVMQNAEPYLAQFAWAIVTNPAVAADIASVFAAVASTAAGPPAVITTAAPHGLADGQTVAIAGTLDPLLPGIWTAHVLTTTTFSIPVAGSGAGTAGGTVTSQPSDADLDVAVASVWNDIAGITPATATV